MSRPLAIDLYAGLGGWAEGLLAEGYDVVGFDIERHVYGEHRYPGQLVIQDALSLHGSQFRDAALIVASPPCQAYSYRAMPWKRAKALPPPDNTLFENCFRIQREACEAAGRHIPLIVENVRGAQPWVGRARWNWGSFYLWGDVPALMPFAGNKLKDIKLGGGAKVDGIGWTGFADTGASWRNRETAIKNASRTAEHNGIKQGGSGRDWWTDRLNERRKAAPGSKSPGGGAEGWFGSNDGPMRRHSSGSAKRKAASALIAKIPLPLARHIARTFHPGGGATRCQEHLGVPSG